MFDFKKLPFSRSDIESVLDGASDADETIVGCAASLYDQGIITVLSDQALPAGAFGYAVENQETAALCVEPLTGVNGCSLLNGTFPLHRGAVLLRDNPGLLCSTGQCGCTTCPFALAACFQALTDLGSSVIPLYSESLDISQDIARFRSLWTPRLPRSESALNLLLSRSENDFSGVLIVDDPSYLDSFVADLAHILEKLGKINENAVERLHIGTLMRSVNEAEAVFRATHDENLKAHTLYVVDRLGDFFDIDYERDFSARYIVERFGHVVDNRYLILSGTDAEITRFLGMSPTLELLMGDHRLNLEGLSASDIYSLYLDELDPHLKESADDGFRDRFIGFVEFNLDVLPFRGVELADYLAKTSNASGVLTLPRSRYRSSSLDEMLNGIVGLEPVKRTIRDLESYALFAKHAQGHGCTMPSSSMHMVFYGNPGTGKTTVARIIATMLYKIGIIPQNKFMEVTSKDLIARYVGHTDKQVAEVMTKARGGVLFIDEAYALAPNRDNEASFAKEALAELVKLMEDYRKDLILILAGYEREMEDFLEINPGLASRIGYRFHFDDFSVDELIQIFNQEMSRAGFSAEAAVEEELQDLFAYFRRFKHFGNGRFARDVLQRAIINHATGISSEDTDTASPSLTLEAKDIPDRRALMDCVEGYESTAEELMSDLVGLKDIKETVKTIERVSAYREEARQAGLQLPDSNLSMVLTGNPGTGKTTVARILASILFTVGAVPSNKFVEIEAKDLLSRYVGGTSQETGKIIERSLGGILFIDEAYALLETSSGREALAVFVKAMEDHKGEFTVMFAGYEAPMRQFIDANPGLASRIGYTLHFEDYEPKELAEMYSLKLSKAGFTFDDSVVEKAEDALRYFHNVENFGNGRFVDRLIQETIAHKALRGGNPQDLESADVPTIDELCKLVANDIYDPSDISADEARQRVAYHEAAHALVGLEETGQTDIIRVTIEQEGTGALGYVQHEKSLPPLPTDARIRSELSMLLAGMAAEKQFFGAWSAGNSSDLTQATHLARAWAATYGMSDAGLVQFVAPRTSARTTTPALTDLPTPVLNAMNEVLAEAFDHAVAILTEQESCLLKLVEQLLENGTLDGETIVSLWKDHRHE